MGHPHQEIEYVADDFGVAEKVDETPAKKPLKPARSEAELTRVKQGKALIFLNCLNVVIASLIALKTFGLI